MKRFYSFFIIAATVMAFYGCNKELPVATLNTTDVTEITSTSALGRGRINDDGGSKVLNVGFCWSTNSNPTINDFRSIENAINSEFTTVIKGLKPGTTYYARAYATNADGTAYGNVISFTTLQAPPVLSEIAFSSVSEESAKVSASIISDGGNGIISRGFCWSKSPNPTINDSKIELSGGVGLFSAEVNDLEAGTTYYFRAFATSTAETAYSQQQAITTASDKPAIVDNDHLLLGNPSYAATNILFANNYFMIKHQYCLSYNNSKRTANWVAWHLNTSWLGGVSRQNDFREDNTLPSSWYRVSASDFFYSQYGFDRGHICPSGDRTATVTDNSATFLMTNMVPQAPNNNQIVWENFESYCRDLAKKGSELYIIAGPYGEGGTSAKGTFTVLKSGVVVPALVWKIAVVLPNGNNDLERITTSTRAIAVVIPNNQSSSDYIWTHYRVSIDSIENLTGYDFLSNVPKEIQDAIEARVDNL